MKTEELWRQLEAEGVGRSGWSTRLARPDPGTRLMVAIDGSGARALLLQASSNSIPPKRDWPNCQGLEITRLSVGGEGYLAVRLRDDASRDVFAALAELLASRLALARTDGEAVAGLLGALRRWQTLLAAGRDGLGVEAQRGLFGELYVLSDILLPALSPLAAVKGWKGFAGASQDFQFDTVAIEVKTSAAVSPDFVRIASERQLDGTGAGSLFLHLVVVDEREVSAEGAVERSTLLSLVEKIRKSVSTDPLASTLLEEGLLLAGWLDAAASRYDIRQLSVRAQHTFLVREGFPRLVENLLPVGVGDVSYSLNLGACQSFRVNSDSMVKLLVSQRARTEV